MFKMSDRYLGMRLFENNLRRQVAVIAADMGEAFKNGAIEPALRKLIDHECVVVWFSNSSPRVYFGTPFSNGIEDKLLEKHKETNEAFQQELNTVFENEKFKIHAQQYIPSVSSEEYKGRYLCFDEFCNWDKYFEPLTGISLEELRAAQENNQISLMEHKDKVNGPFNLINEVKKLRNGMKEEQPEVVGSDSPGASGSGVSCESSSHRVTSPR